jgi:hypothetical protein
VSIVEDYAIAMLSDGLTGVACRESQDQQRNGYREPTWETRASMP